MKPISIRLSAVFLASATFASAQVAANYRNFIRQVQFPSGVQWDADVVQTGEQQSALEINPGGARFELHTVMRISPFTSHLLDSKYVGAFVPIAQVTIRTEDPYNVVPRTRAGRPFYVDYIVSGLRAGATDPAATKSVNFLHHAQSYGPGGTGVNLDRTQATLLNQYSISADGTSATTVNLLPDQTPIYTVTRTLAFPVNSVPGSPANKVRGEERISFFSLNDYQAPPSQLVSKYVQIWPEADGNIAGITHNQLVRFSVPSLTITANDIYPGSSVYAQVYKGNQRNNTVVGVDAAIVPGSHENMPSSSVPQNRVFVINDWDEVLTSDGRWTIELLTETPFDVVYLQRLSFDLDRTITVNGSVTTINN